MFCLLFKNSKACNLQQLKENFDFDTAQMYLLGGSLAVWLEQCGETDLAQQIRNIDLNGDIILQMSEIFSIEPPDSYLKAKSANRGTVNSDENQSFKSVQKPLTSFEEAADVNRNNDLFSENKALSSSFSEEDASSFASADVGSFKAPSFENEASSFELNLIESSFAASSFELSLSGSSFVALSTGSFGLGIESSSFNQLLTSFEQRSFSFETFELTGSFLSSSFNLGSFGEYEYEYEYEYESSFTNLLTGSFSTGSFVSGSFNLSSFDLDTAPESFNSASLLRQVNAAEKAENNEKNIAPTKKTEKIFLPKAPDDLPPEEKIKQNIRSCPLNRFGYGIHLI